MNLTVPHEEDGLKKQQYHCVVKILYPISLRLSIHSSKFAAKMQRFGANVQKSVVKMEFTPIKLDGLHKTEGKTIEYTEKTAV